MATPVSWKGIVEQYAGRLNRDYEGKQDVVVYDYIDSHIPQISQYVFKTAQDIQENRVSDFSRCGAEEAGGWAIYDSGNYTAVFEQDLIEAEKRLSFPAHRSRRIRWNG